MIALEAFAQALEEFRYGDFLTWEFGGHNLSTDRKNFLTWTAGSEMRVFPRNTTRFLWSAEASAGGYDGPIADTGVSRDWALATQEALYAHMKYCMRDPGRIQSPKFRKKLESRISVGALVPADVDRTVCHWLSEADAFPSLDGCGLRQSARLGKPAGRKCRVFFISSNPPVPTWGGAMAFYRHFAEREDFEVAVATDNPEVHDFPGVFPLTFFSPPSWLERLKRTRFYLWAHTWQHLMAGRHVLPAVVDAAVRFRPDVIMTVAGSWSWATDMAAVLSRRLGVPLVGSFNDWFDYSLILAPPFRPVLERKFRRFYLSCDLALCTSEGMREALGPHPNAIVHYPMGAERKEQIAKHRDRGDRPLRVLYGGSVAQWYGQMLEKIISAAKQSGVLGREIEFVVCGANPGWSSDFERWARESGIYLGQVPFAELRRQAANSDALFVLMGFGSENEQVERTSFKTKFLDYLSFERPVCVWGPSYSSAVLTAREFDSAEVCDSPSEHDCLSMLRALAADRKRPVDLMANAAKMYEARFHPERIHSRLLEECRKLLPGDLDQAAGSGDSAADGNVCAGMLREARDKAGISRTAKLSPPSSFARKVMVHLAWRADQFHRRFWNKALRSRWLGRRKRITAMIRVRDGEEFLLASVLSIMDAVDEVVIVDNMSKDSTSEIIARLVACHPDRVKSFYYPHDCVRLGEDFRNLYRQDSRSPRLATVYSNWCLARCTNPFVMKWDDDMIALDTFAEAVGNFRLSGALGWHFGGHNLSADREHVLTWTAGIEPRVYPKASTRFIRSAGAAANGYEGETEDTTLFSENVLVSQEPLYAHLKYCKKNPGSNQSPQFRKELESRITIGNPIPDNVERSVSRWMRSADSLLVACH
jgi:hypothetical protein